MALGALAPAQDNWDRWPQSQPPASEFNMMGSSMGPYDWCRPGGAAPVPRPEMAQQFLSAPFNPAPMPSPTAPQYLPPISYGAYQPYSTPPMLDAPLKVQEGSDSVDGSPSLRRSQSPAIKSEARSPLSPSSPPPETIMHETPAPGAPAHQFNTAIDKIVRVIEAKREILIPEDKVDLGQLGGKKDGKEDQVERARTKAKRKRFFCDIPGCSKMFAQRNNLETHRRSHTGESPYVCPFCCRRFTQSVNLKSHINRHTGARPYRCSLCPKTFPQPSNVKAHMKTHVKRELRAHWVCRFGDCQRNFTAKGNLKNHQNQYHVKEIEAFNAKLAATVDKSMLSPEDIEMAQYIAEVHNLANKGIKGRGKGRKVKRVTIMHLPHEQQPQHHHHHHHQQQQQHQLPSPAPSPVATTIHTAGPCPLTLLPHGLPNLNSLPYQPHLQPAPQHHPYYGFSNPAAYSMSPAAAAAAAAAAGPNGGGAHARPPPSGMLFRPGPGAGPAPGPYGMLDADQLSDVSSVHGSTPVMMHHPYHPHHSHHPPHHPHEHGHHHQGELAYGERLY